MRGGDKETGHRQHHPEQVLCQGERATPSLERRGVRQVCRAGVRRVRGQQQVTVRGSQTPSAPSAHCSSLLTGGLPGKSRPREDRATHRGDPWLQQVSSAGMTKGHGVAGCGASWKSLQGLLCQLGNWENLVCTRRCWESPAQHLSSPEAPISVEAPGVGGPGKGAEQVSRLE